MGSQVPLQNLWLSAHSTGLGHLVTQRAGKSTARTLQGFVPNTRRITNLNTHKQISIEASGTYFVDLFTQSCTPILMDGFISLNLLYCHDSSTLKQQQSVNSLRTAFQLLPISSVVHAHPFCKGSDHWTEESTSTCRPQRWQ